MGRTFLSLLARSNKVVGWISMASVMMLATKTSGEHPLTVNLFLKVDVVSEEYCGVTASLQSLQLHARLTFKNVGDKAIKFRTVELSRTVRVGRSVKDLNSGLAEVVISEEGLGEADYKEPQP